MHAAPARAFELSAFSLNSHNKQRPHTQSAHHVSLTCATRWNSKCYFQEAHTSRMEKKQRRRSGSQRATVDHMSKTGYSWSHERNRLHVITRAQRATVRSHEHNRLSSITWAQLYTVRSHHHNRLQFDHTSTTVYSLITRAQQATVWSHEHNSLQSDHIITTVYNLITWAQQATVRSHEHNSLQFDHIITICYNLIT
jgi:hypothetical protein